MKGPVSGYTADWRQTVHNGTATEVAMRQEEAQKTYLNAFRRLMEHRAAAMLPTEPEPEPAFEKQEPPPLDGPVFGL